MAEPERIIIICAQSPGAHPQFPQGAGNQLVYKRSCTAVQLSNSSNSATRVHTSARIIASLCIIYQRFAVYKHSSDYISLPHWINIYKHDQQQNGRIYCEILLCVNSAIDKHTKQIHSIQVHTHATWRNKPSCLSTSQTTSRDPDRRTPCRKRVKDFSTFSHDALDDDPTTTFAINTTTTAPRTTLAARPRTPVRPRRPATYPTRATTIATTRRISRSHAPAARRAAVTRAKHQLATITTPP